MREIDPEAVVRDRVARLVLGLVGPRHQIISVKDGLALSWGMHLFISYLNSPFDPMRFAMRRAVLAASLVLIPSLALRHPRLPGHSHDLASGLMHPIGGLDHVLAMVAVGLLAAQLGGRALWLGPAGLFRPRAAPRTPRSRRHGVSPSPCGSRPRWRWSASSRSSTATLTASRRPRRPPACSMVSASWRRPRCC